MVVPDVGDVHLLANLYPQVSYKRAIQTFGTSKNANRREILLFAPQILADSVPEEDFSTAAYFAVCLGRSRHLVKSFPSIKGQNYRNLLKMLNGLCHVPDHLVTLFASSMRARGFIFTELNFVRSLCQRTTLLEASLLQLPQ